MPEAPEFCNECDEHFGKDFEGDGQHYTCWHPEVGGTDTLGPVEAGDIPLISRPPWCPLENEGV